MGMPNNHLSGPVKDSRLGLIEKNPGWHLRIPCPGFACTCSGFTFWYCLSRKVGVLASSGFPPGFLWLSDENF